jgi:hypothetical protein
MTMEVITYTLRDSSGHSDRYYQEVAVFAKRVVGEAEIRMGDILIRFDQDRSCLGGDPPRLRPESTLDLLHLGVLWRIYGGGDFSMNGLAQLIKFLTDSKRLEQHAGRLGPWAAFLAGLSAGERAALVEDVLSLGDWFERESQAELSRYTPNVDRFLSEVFPAYRGREDEVLCGRRRVEYHLCMVGTEILSRAYREAFLATHRKILIVPSCMKARPDGECQADPTPLGMRCAGCTADCHVYAVTRLGEERGVEVLILPEDLAVFRPGSGAGFKGASIGIIGVSCVLTNVDGGWKTRRLGVPAQGLLLDYCGCSYHWHPWGIATDINRQQLLKVLED